MMLSPTWKVQLLSPIIPWGKVLQKTLSSRSSINWIRPSFSGYRGTSIGQGLPASSPRRAALSLPYTSFPMDSWYGRDRGAASGGRCRQFLSWLRPSLPYRGFPPDYSTYHLFNRWHQFTFVLNQP